MFRETLRDEVLNPPHLSDTLEQLGLVGVHLTTEEFVYADMIYDKYVKLSTPDRIALAIAYNRKITLLTGDKALRNAAEKEGVKVLGTIGLLDLMLDQDCIDDAEYQSCLREFLNHPERRLPQKELQKRIDKEVEKQE